MAGWFRSMMAVRMVVLPFAALLTVACGAAVPEIPEREPVSYAEHLEPLVIAHCLACHEAEDPKAELVLDPGVGYGELVGKHSIQVPAMKLVQPGDLDASYLWLKLQHRSPEGKGMPRTLTGSKKLRPAEIELYRRWIEGGARP